VNDSIRGSSLSLRQRPHAVPMFKRSGARRALGRLNLLHDLTLLRRSQKYPRSASFTIAELRLGQQLHEPLILLLRLFEPLGSSSSHAAILIPRTMARLLDNLQANRLANIQQRVAITQLPYNLLRAVSGPAGPVRFS
jgi:hypothetical protein